MIDLPQPKRRGRPRGRTRPVRPVLFHSNERGPRPLTWKVGPDPVLHAKHVAFLRARCQARFRKEPWDLTFEQYVELWGDQWSRRGRTRDTVCLGRIDYDLGWSVHNCDIITRREHNLRQVEWKAQKNGL